MELLVTLIIGIMIVGLVFLVPQLIDKQNTYNNSFNTAKNEVLLISNTLMEKLEQADYVSFNSSTNTITISAETTAQFIFTQNPSPKEYLYDVSYNGRSMGTVGFDYHQLDTNNTFFILTLWSPFHNTNSVEEKFIITQGFHASVINQ